MRSRHNEKPRRGGSAGAAWPLMGGMSREALRASWTQPPPEVLGSIAVHFEVWPAIQPDGASRLRERPGTCACAGPLVGAVRRTTHGIPEQWPLIDRGHAHPSLGRRSHDRPSCRGSFFHSPRTLTPTLCEGSSKPRRTRRPSTSRRRVQYLTWLASHSGGSATRPSGPGACKAGMVDANRCAKRVTNPCLRERCAGRPGARCNELSCRQFKLYSRSTEPASASRALPPLVDHRVLLRV
jgi:hypothetical protein